MTLWKWRKRKSSLLFPIYYLIYNSFISKPSNDTATVTETEVDSPKKEERFLLAYVKYICIFLSYIFLFEIENINCRIPTQIIVYTFP